MIDKKGGPQCGPCHWVEKVHNAPYDIDFLIRVRQLPWVEPPFGHAPRSANDWPGQPFTPGCPDGGNAIRWMPIAVPGTCKLAEHDEALPFADRNKYMQNAWQRGRPIMER